MDEPFPLVSKELIAALDRLYPDRCPAPDMPLAEVMYRSGQASVVRKLKLEFKHQLSS